jgi:hypothetical protein
MNPLKSMEGGDIGSRNLNFRDYKSGYDFYEAYFVDDDDKNKTVYTTRLHL